MRNRAESTGKRRAGAIVAVGQLQLPVIVGIAQSTQALLEWVERVGLAALSEVFEDDAEQLAGPKGKHRAAGWHYRWGSIFLPFGERWIRLLSAPARDSRSRDPTAQPRAVACG